MMDKEIRFKPDSFELVQSNIRITDKKLETKPTTFFKDAFRRFCKNKSSIVAAFILAILILLTIFVPVLSPSNITNVNVTERMLAPKLFESGTGFWDGTRKMERVVYDTVNEVPAVSDRYSVAALKNALVKIRVDEEPTPVDMANQYGVGGLVVMATDAAVDGKDVYMTSKPVSLTSQGGYRLKVALDGEDNVQGSRLGEYRVFLKGNDGTEIIVRDFSTDYSDIDFDISKALADAGKPSLTAQVVFDLKSSADAFKYILVKSVELTTETGKNAEQLENVS
ncbi:MAG: hypothetical protein IK056_10470, partial [Clostridia bacterium]|nr:hypothetical protein [Clostridia bacterium]